MISLKYGSIDRKLTVLIIFAEIYIQSSEYIVNKNIYYKLHLRRLKQEIIRLHTCTKLSWNWANDEIINLMKLIYLLNY